MSTKIYDAYRMPRSVDLLEFQTRLRELGMPMRHRLDAAETVESAALKLSDLDAFGDTSAKPLHPVSAAIREHRKEQRELSPFDSDHDPHRFEVSFVPHGEWVGFKLFTSRRDYASVVDALADEFAIEEYHYQDQSDQPENVSDTDWMARSKFWDGAVGDDAWAQRGLSFALAPDVNIHTVDVLEHSTSDMVPSPERLAENVAKRLVLEAAATFTPVSIGNVMALCSPFRYPDEFTAAIAALLPPVVLGDLFIEHPGSRGTVVTADHRAQALGVAHTIIDGRG